MWLGGDHLGIAGLSWLVIHRDLVSIQYFKQSVVTNSQPVGNQPYIFLTDSRYLLPLQRGVAILLVLVVTFDSFPFENCPGKTLPVGRLRHHLLGISQLVATREVPLHSRD